MTNKQEYVLVGFIVLMGVIARVCFHLPNFVPMLALIICLFRRWSLSVAVPTLFALQFFSDIFLNPNIGFAAFGTWSIFTYSGFLALLLLSSRFGKQWQAKQQLLFTVPCSFGYWVWTNFGTWLASGMYAHSISGLTNCFVKGLPFLHGDLISDAFWVVGLSAVQFMFARLAGDVSMDQSRAR